MRRRLMIGAIGAGVAGTAPAAQWTVTPSLGVQEVITDNVGASQINKKADAITQLLPAVSVLGESAANTLQLSYSPTISAYVANPGQDRIDQNLNGTGSYVPFENRLTIDYQVFAAQNSGNGGYFTPAASNLVPRNDRVLNYGAVIDPHYSQHFSDVATLDASYRVSSSNSSRQNGNSNNNSNGLSNSLLQQDAQVLVGSGDSFGRLVTTLDLDHVTGSGSGLNNQFSNDYDVVQFEYHVTHEYSITSSVGYERTHYDRTNGSLGYNQSGLTWSIGFRATPNDKTTLDFSYGKRQGSDDVNAHLTYDLAPRTLISGSYTVTVENQLQSSLGNLPFLAFDTSGNPVDSRTGLPFNQFNQAFGQQNTLFRDKNAQIAITHEFTRSSVSLTAYSQDREPLSGTTTPNDGWGLTASYTQDLTPVLKGNADIGYNNFRGTGFGGFGGFGGGIGGIGNIGGSGGNGKFINADAGLTYQINETVTANVIYSFGRRISSTLNNSETTNQLTIGLRKTFY